MYGHFYRLSKDLQGKLDAAGASVPRTAPTNRRAGGSGDAAQGLGTTPCTDNGIQRSNLPSSSPHSSSAHSGAHGNTAEGGGSFAEGGQEAHDRSTSHGGDG
eukprot:4024339-Pleurochrysis_carterae.AAC.1